MEIEGYPIPGVAALSVNSPDEDCAQIENIFRHCRWTLRSSPNVNSAMTALRRYRLPVVLCDGSNWKEMLARTRDLADPPVLIVTSRVADEYLWAEALNLGAYDVLPKPFDTNEVVRVVSLAWLHGQNHPIALPATKVMVA
jgi:DNA-binding response OmpR family regulator